MECGGFWFYLSNQSSTQRATPLSTTLHLHPMPTCLPSSHTLPWCPQPTCTQGWQGVWATWALSTSPSTTLISTQSRVSWRQYYYCIITLRYYLFVLSTLFWKSSYWVKPFILSVFQNCLVYLITALFFYISFSLSLYLFRLLLWLPDRSLLYSHCIKHKCCLFGHSVSADSHSQHGRPAFVHRDDRTSKTYERLQKKLKERQVGGGQVKDSPPPSPQKTCSSPPAADIHNGVGGKGLEAEQGQLSHAVAGPDTQTGRGKNGESGGKEVIR